MEILERIRVFRRWLWLIVLVGLVFAAGGYFIRSRQAPVYQTTAKVLIGSFVRASNPDTQQLQTGNELVKTYAELAHAYDILEQVVQTYNLPMSADDLRARTRIVINGQAPILEVTASYSDPETAAQMANGITEQLILRSPTNLTLEQQNQRAFLQSEIANLSEQLNGLRIQLRDVSKRERDAFTFETLQELRSERLTLTGNIIELSNIIATLSQTLVSLQDRVNELTIFEHARVPENPGGVGVSIIAGLGFVVGAMMAGGAVLVVDELDQTMKSSSRVKRSTGLPVLSIIRSFSTKREPGPHWLIAKEQPLSPAADAYRMLQSRLLYTSHEPSYEYIFTSAGEGEGKSMTAVNLAVTMGTAGFRVLIIDMNLRKPVLHQIFEVENTGGLAKLLLMSPDDAISSEDTDLKTQFADFIRPTKIPDVYVMPRGKLDDDAAISVMMFRLHQFNRWMDILRTKYGIDMFIFDTAPCLASSESLVLAGALPSEIVLVVEAGRTRREDAQEALEQFTHTGSQVKGVVLNKL